MRKAAIILEGLGLVPKVLKRRGCRTQTHQKGLLFFFYTFTSLVLLSISILNSWRLKVSRPY